MADLRANARERAQRADLLSFQANEIESARLEADEDTRLAAELTILSNAESLHAAIARAYGLIYESPYPDASSARDMLGEALEELDDASHIDTSLASLGERMSELCDQAGEIARALREYRDSIEVQPERLAGWRRLSVIAFLRNTAIRWPMS